MDIWYLMGSNLVSNGIYLGAFLVSKWYLIDTKLTLDTWWEPCDYQNGAFDCHYLLGEIYIYIFCLNEKSIDQKRQLRIFSPVVG